MIYILAASVAGVLVCLFGMWAFLKGQSTMQQIQSGGKPQMVDRAVNAPRKGGMPDLTDQVRALFTDSGAKRGE